jgi:hypothetical protein
MRFDFGSLKQAVYSVIPTAAVFCVALRDLAPFSRGTAPTSLLLLSVLALLANACNAAAYFADIRTQRSSQRTVWKHRRWGLWLAGRPVAIVLANHWIADEIYPLVR